MDSFKNLYQEKIEEKEHKIFCEFVEMLEKNDLLEESVLLDEGFFSNSLDKVKNVLKSIPAQLKEKFNFIKDLAINLKLSLIDLLKVFKNKIVFNIFKALKWSMKTLFLKLKKGYEIYAKLPLIISEFINKNDRITKWTDPLLKELSEFIHNHPVFSKIAGLGLGCLCLYIWLSMSFIGDPIGDFDLSFIYEAVIGKTTFYDIFSGSDGLALLSLFAVGTFTGLTVPWDTIIKSSAQLSVLSGSVLNIVVGIFITLGKQAGVKIKEKVKYTKEDEDEMNKILADT